MSTTETDGELIHRYHHVKVLVEKAQKRSSRMKPGGAKDRAARWTGSLRFTLLQIEREISERGLEVPSA